MGNSFVEAAISEQDAGDVSRTLVAQACCNAPLSRCAHFHVVIPRAGGDPEYAACLLLAWTQHGDEPPKTHRADFIDRHGVKLWYVEGSKLLHALAVRRAAVRKDVRDQVNRVGNVDGTITISITLA